jgi:hypothetical protein
METAVMTLALLALIAALALAVLLNSPGVTPPRIIAAIVGVIALVLIVVTLI